MGDKASVDRSGGISFVPHRHRWNMGGIANEPAMQLVSDWWVTNRTETDVFVLRAELIFRDGLRRKVLNQMQPMDRGTAGAMNAIGLLFWIVPPICRENEDLKARIVIIDNFNRRHEVGKMIFKGPKARKFPD
jgi:hypothetical protein